MASSTRLRVSSLTYLVPLMTCETVAVETPASRATSLILEVLKGGRGGCSTTCRWCSSLISPLPGSSRPVRALPGLGGAWRRGNEASQPASYFVRVVFKSPPAYGTGRGRALRKVGYFARGAVSRG